MGMSGGGCISWWVGFITGDHWDRGVLRWAWKVHARSVGEGKVGLGVWGPNTMTVVDRRRIGKRWQYMPSYRSTQRKPICKPNTIS